MDIDITRFYKVFFEESSEGIEAMEAGLLALGSSHDPEVINVVFRAAHSIKGSSGSLGLSEIAGFTHFLETLLDEMRAGKRTATPESLRVLLDSVDCLREMLEAKRDGKPFDGQRIQQVTDRLQQLLSGTTGAVTREGSEAGSEKQSAGKWRILFRPHLHLFRTGNDPARLLRELGRLGDLTVLAHSQQVPALAEMNAEDCYLSWELWLSGNVDERQIREVFDWVESDCELLVEKTSEETIAAPAASAAVDPELAASSGASTATPSPNTARGREGSSIRVSTDKVDAIINLVGELVITQSMLSCVGEQFELSMLDKLRDGLALLARNTRELQETVLKIRMLPISFTFNRFPRLVHDLSAKLEKKVVLKLTGEQTELDKTVLEKISDPLIHLVRNSLDHGIEKPEVRRAAGKPEAGTIHLHAAHQGGSIVIEVRDDGAGLNTNRILAKARQNGLVGQDEHLSDEKIHELIFAPGFSTAEEITDVSGRGVGMDVVRRNIKELGGNIEIQTEARRGTTFFIRLPLTLAILDGQLVRVADQTYVIPLVSIVESIQVKRSHVSRVAEGTELYRLRDQYIPVLRLYEIFNLRPVVTRLEDGLLVVIEADGQQAGVFVDDLLAQQQVVIKSLESNFRPVDGVSGATILGDGTVSVILDIPGILRLARAQSLRHNTAQLEPTAA
jgi:two-component system chemotaxis sensor kinase CheA